MNSFNCNLIKNAYPPFLINKVIKKCHNHKFSCNQNQSKDTSALHFFKLPYIGNLLHHIKNELCKEFCEENFTIKQVFN